MFKAVYAPVHVLKTAPVAATATVRARSGLAQAGSRVTVTVCAYHHDALIRVIIIKT